MAQIQKTNCVFSMYSPYSKNEINDSGIYYMPEGWLHITHFLATKESEQVSIPKQKNLHSIK